MIGNIKQANSRRRRGAVLTHTGLKRLQTAIQMVEIAEKKGERLTLDELGERINVSNKTLSRLWSLHAGVDIKTLELCFKNFNLELTKADYSVIDKPQESASSDVFTFSLDNKKAKPIELVAKGVLAKEQPEELTQSTALLEETSRRTLTTLSSYPDGPVPLDSPFYIERPLIEKLAYREITQPGSLIRIKAPRGMGKSSLVLRLLAFAETQGYQKLFFNCLQIDALCLSDFNKILRCFSKQLGKALGAAPMLDDYWDEEIGSKLSCSFYLHHLLQHSQNPVVLVLEEVERLFAHPQIAEEFFSLLRSWYEEARHDLHWHKLRLVVVYSTAEYINFGINHSPFNIGLPLHLPKFTQPQIEELARRHGLDWSWGDESAQLMSLVGGHPALIRIALYYLCCKGITLKELVQEALANGGIYRNHLWRQWIMLQDNPDLVEALARVLTVEQRLPLNPLEIYKLECMGLICCDDERIKFCCELYHAYFKTQLSVLNLLGKHSFLQAQCQIR